MAARKESIKYYADLRQRIINHLLTHPTATGEELRRAACETSEVMWVQLRGMIAEGKLQKGKVKGSKTNKYRLHPEFRKSLETSSLSPA